MLNSELVMGQGQGHKLELAFRALGWTNADIEDLSDHRKLRLVLPLLRGIVKFSIPLEVDYAIRPSLIGYKLVGQGRSSYHTDKVTIDVVELKRTGACMLPFADYKKISPDIRVLEELLKHHELIWEDWKEGRTIFYGTTFADPEGQYLYGCLQWGPWAGTRMTATPHWEWGVVRENELNTPGNYIALL